MFGRQEIIWQWREKRPHSPAHIQLWGKLHVVRDSCAKDMKRKRNSAMDRNEMNRHGVEWNN